MLRFLHLVIETILPGNSLLQPETRKLKRLNEERRTRSIDLEYFHPTQEISLTISYKDRKIATPRKCCSYDRYCSNAHQYIGSNTRFPF